MLPYYNELEMCSPGINLTSFRADPGSGDIGAVWPHLGCHKILYGPYGPHDTMWPIFMYIENKIYVEAILYCVAPRGCIVMHS